MNLDFDFLYHWTLDAEGKVTHTNAKAKQLSSDPFSGLNKEDREALKKLIEIRDPAGLYLPWIDQHSDKTVWLKWNVQKKDDHIFLCAFDVTDVKNKEHSLNQILDAIPDLVLVKGEGSRIVWANKAFQDHYGLSNEQLKEMVDAPFVEPDFTKQYIIDDKTVWETGKPLLIECEPVVRHDGVIRNFQTKKTPIFGPRNNVILTVGVSRDITEKIAHEEKSIAAARIAAIGEMSGGMAHEVNNPIAVIAGKVFLLKRLLHKQDEVSKELLLNYLDTIETHVERISSIINVMRRLSVNNDFEDFRTVNLSKIVQDTLLISETRIKEKGISLIIQVPEKLMVDLRAIQFSRAILNLLNNAADAVEFESERWIRLEAREVGKNLELMVMDSGKGVPEEIEGKIMQPFFTTKDVGKGSGLGLSFALSVAKNHQGTLKVAREISASCFLMTIPLRQKS